MDGSTDIATTFAAPCLHCGATTHVVDTARQPHDCTPPESLADALARAWFAGHDYATEHTTSARPVVSAGAHDDLLAEARDHIADLQQEIAGHVATVGVLSAAVAKVADLHSDDGDGWCRACQTISYPCPTVLALGGGR